jgi:2-C-methyl-D-erythritol 2,4-cyclodiphosphate synthase
MPELPSQLPRTGIGYDVHRFAPGRDLVLGGVNIPHIVGLSGHSDADVLCHAIADAVLGSLGKPDIGYYFPPSDPTIEGISSLEILTKAAAVIAEEGATLVNVDSTLVMEAPRIMPHVPAMREKIATALGIPAGRVGIKATTNETMGFVGREEGIAAFAVASVLAPSA